LDLPTSLPEYGELSHNAEDLTVLLMGKHGSNVDTIMFAYVDVSERKVTLISVPRDLYVNERKINSVYADYGVYEQVRWVEEVLGYQIDKFVLIDMYVFQDLVDLMGGIDIVLEEPLIDPTYRVCDDGVCSTLYYEAGEHHLDGTAALRIARSRHTTSDYSRAARQQLILEGMQNKAQSLGLGNADTVLSMIATTIGSTDTNISLDEAVRYYFTYQNFWVSRGYVLSSGNVLENIQLPVDYVTSLTTEVCLDENNPSTCEESYAIYTLAPRDDDWDAVRWYVEELLY
jgi:polyisoprenyl-teichoic acid--peptidoglycan teichoic acid transferase